MRDFLFNKSFTSFNEIRCRQGFDGINFAFAEVLKPRF